MKRFFDITVSAVLILFSAPLLLIIAGLVKIKLGSPILFAQTRPGLGAKPFTLFKFRTMRNAVDKNGALLPDQDRLTEFGRFLRSSSLDELPELWNVFVGEMSLVGPRPLLMEYLPLYNAEQFRRHDVRPGITGWAQVNGRNQLSWEEKFALDVWYCEHQSLLLDIKIILKTVGIIFARSGISNEGHATMPPFTGSSTGENAGNP